VLLLDLSRGFAKGLLPLRLEAAGGGCYPRDLLLQTLHAVGEAVLLPGDTARRIGGVRSARTGRRLVPELPLPIGELPRFKLQITKRPPAFIGLGALQLSLERPQSLQCTVAPRAGLPGVLAPEITRRTSHLLGGFPQLRTRGGGCLSMASRGLSSTAG